MEKEQVKKMTTPHALGLTVKGTVFKITGPNEFEGNRYVNASMALNGCNWALKELTGHDFPEGETVFMRLSFKNYSADRFLEIANGREKFPIVAGGRVQINEFEKDGIKTVDGVKMFVNGFWEDKSHVKAESSKTEKEDPNDAASLF